MTQEQQLRHEGQKQQQKCTYPQACPADGGCDNPLNARGTCISPLLPSRCLLLPAVSQALKLWQALLQRLQPCPALL